MAVNADSVTGRETATPVGGCIAGGHTLLNNSGGRVAEVL